MKFLNTRSIGILLATCLVTSGCVTAAKTAVGGTLKGARMGTKAAVSTVGTAAKVTGSAVGGKDQEAAPK